MSSYDSFRQTVDYITRHGGRIPAHLFQSSAFGFAIDYVNSALSNGKLIITTGRKTTGSPLLCIHRTIPEGFLLTGTVFRTDDLRWGSLPEMKKNLTPWIALPLRKDKGPSHCGEIVGYITQPGF